MGETPMNRSPVRGGSSQLAIAVLLLADLAGCGKQEAAPVVRPPAVPVFEPQAVEVKLGKSGDSVTLRTTEAGGFTLEGKAVESGAEVRAENGNMYTLTLVDGEWIVAFNAPGPVSVTLGTSGTTVTIETAEDGSYWLDEEFFESGDTVAAQNGNTYILTLVAGEWSPVFQPKSMEIIGIDLMAMSREDGTGYDVGDQELDEYGWGDIVIDGDHFGVSRNDMGMLMAEQFDAKSEAFLTDREASRNKFGGTLPDNEDTAYNEAGTKLTIDGTEYSIGELFDDGEASRKSANIVAEQRKAIERALTRINRLIAVIKAGNEDETGREGDFNQQFIDRWSDIDDALDNIFGDPDAGADPNTDNEGIDHLPDLPEKLADIVSEVEKVLAALARLEAFEEALGEGGIFENSRGDIKDEEIERVFDAVEQLSSVRLGRSENTRFGVYSKRTRRGSAKDTLSPAAPPALASLPHQRPSQISALQLISKHFGVKAMREKPSPTAGINRDSTLEPLLLHR